jgi:hypothetical protein
MPDTYANDQRCPFCGEQDASCLHYVALFNRFDGGIDDGPGCTNANALWIALTEAVRRAAAGGNLRLGKVSADFDHLLEKAREFGVQHKIPEDASAEFLNYLIEVAAEIADSGPSALSAEAISPYGGYPAEDPVTVYWSRHPERYAAYIKARTKAVATSVGKVRQDKT